MEYHDVSFWMSGERLGVTIYERTPVTALTPGSGERSGGAHTGDRGGGHGRPHGARGVAGTPFGRVRTDVLVRATEGYTATLPGARRTLAPLYSLMIATAPLPASFWAGRARDVQRPPPPDRLRSANRFRPLGDLVHRLGRAAHMTRPPNRDRSGGPFQRCIRRAGRRPAARRRSP
ncbi:hypothetical protein JCM9534A_34370 [Catenuloplanes indicus JCM 9534]